MINWPLATDTWDTSEINALHKVIDSRNFTMGNTVEEFQEAFCYKFGSKYAVMVNSGSSANLLMVAGCVELGLLEPGDEVIVPAVAWGTSYFPFSQHGLKVVVVDVDNTWNISPSHVRKAITSRTRAVLAVNILGNPCAFDQLQEICDDHDLILLEDNCESLGALVDSKYTGTFGRVGTHSTFFSHHLQTMEGGMITTNDVLMFNLLKSLRSHGWIRNTNGLLPTEMPQDEFTFVCCGYNVRPGELHAAVGLVQLDKFDKMDVMRTNNATTFKQEFGNEPWCKIQHVEQKNQSSWFAFGVVLDKKIDRDHIRKVLEDQGVQTRPIVAGNIARQPVFNTPRFNGSIDWSTGKAPLEVADDIHNNGFMLGNNPTDLREQITKTKLLIQGII
jgi:CDP-6-deoxy-D-xylo-4-hexulose-3-dehydrase